MKEIKECLRSAGTALFPYDWRSNDCVRDPGCSPACTEKEAVRFHAIYVENISEGAGLYFHFPLQSLFWVDRKVLR